MAPVRVAAHVHSEWSYDGSYTLAALARAFRRRRYRAVLMAEHDRGFDEPRWQAYRDACANASRDGIVLVPGIEYSDPTNTAHVPVWGDVPFLGEGLETAELLARAAAAGGVAVLAHPERRGALAGLDPELLSGLSGIELWNRKYDGYAPSRAAAALLRERGDLMAFAGLDFHTARQFHPLAMLLDLEGPVTPEAVYDALAGRRARPAAFGLPAERMSAGRAVVVLHGSERARKAARGRLRRLRAATRPEVRTGEAR